MEKGFLIWVVAGGSILLAGEPGYELFETIMAPIKIRVGFESGGP